MRKNAFAVSIPLAIIITLIAIIYQRTTGPTYPRKFHAQTAQGEKITFKLPRSQENNAPASIEIPLLSTGMKGEVFYRRYPTNEPFIAVPLVKENNDLVGKLPIQPAAGKLEYYVRVNDGGKILAFASAQDPIVIRYKGPVPIWILAPHIFCMFLSMLFSAIVAVEAFFKTEKFYPLTLFTTGCLMIGGMILGPFVQKYAFGVYWAGFPYGFDLTDNKLLIGVVAWLIAAVLSWKKRRPLASIIAAIVLIIVYSIPHSKMGSQFNYQKNELQTEKKF